MRLLVIALATVAVVVHAMDLDPDLVQSALRIARVEHDIEELAHDIEEAGKIDPLGFFKEMHARLDHYEGRFSRFHLRLAERSL